MIMHFSYTPCLVQGLCIFQYLCCRATSSSHRAFDTQSTLRITNCLNKLILFDFPFAWCARFETQLKSIFTTSVETNYFPNIFLQMWRQEDPTSHRPPNSWRPNRGAYNNGHHCLLVLNQIIILVRYFQFRSDKWWIQLESFNT